MADNKTINPAEQVENKFILPCEIEHFAEFISGLLGKPQTIEKNFFSPYEVNRNNIQNLFDLVSQRVSQQNDAKLVQFTVSVSYSDGSSVLHNSLSDFVAYNEVRPLVSESCTLSWILLIKFPDKDSPEKQVIEISFRTLKFARITFSEDGDTEGRFKNLGRGKINLRIEHTARTWGSDIEALLSGHLETLFLKESPTHVFAREHSFKIGFSVFCLFLISAFAFALLTEVVPENRTGC